MCDNGGRFAISLSNDSISERGLVFAVSDYKFYRTIVPGGKTTMLTVKLQQNDLQNGFDVVASERLKSKPAFRLLLNAAKLVYKDYIPIGNPETNKFDFGRVRTIASYNYLEGLRLRGGFASTSRFHPHLFVKGYAAYGTLDQKMKYRGEVAWAFNTPKYHEGEYPAHNLRFVHQYDVYSPGENHPHSQNDELLYSFRQAKGSMAYLRFTEINYEQEFYSGFSHILWLNNRTMTPAQKLVFNQDGTFHSELKTTEIGFRLRYSPREAFRQNRRSKRLLSVKNPIFQFSYSMGLKNVIDGENRYHRTEFSVQKRFLFGAYGHFDVAAEAQQVWSKVPFPLLLFPNANPSYLIENDSFSLLNAMEFINDKQYIAKATYVADNLLLARIPYLNYLSLREVFSIRGVYGTLSKKNNPAFTMGLFAFPGLSSAMGSTPYLEAGIGIANILNIFRVDYVFRLTYRDTPNAIKNGIRVGFSL